MKVLRVAGRIITVQVCACRPRKQSAGCEREVMHHWCRNTNMELCFVCPPVSLLGLSFSALSHDLLCADLGDCRAAGGNIQTVMDAHEIGLVLFCCLCCDTAGTYSKCTTKGLSATELLNRELTLWARLYNNNSLLLLFLWGPVPFVCKLTATTVEGNNPTEVITT